MGPDRTQTVQLSVSHFLSPTTAPETASVSLHVGAGAGVWELCFKPEGGVWTHLASPSFSSRSLVLLHPPSFSPAVGVAAMVTVVSMAGVPVEGEVEGESYSVAGGAWVFFREGGCGGGPPPVLCPLPPTPLSVDLTIELQVP